MSEVIIEEDSIEHKDSLLGRGKRGISQETINNT
jgi:hypothetical protein